MRELDLGMLTDGQKKTVTQLLARGFKLDNKSINELFEFMWLNVRVVDFYQPPIYISSALFMTLSLLKRDVGGPVLEITLDNFASVAKRESCMLLLMAVSTFIINKILNFLLHECVSLNYETKKSNEKIFSRLQPYEDLVNIISLGSLFFSLITLGYLAYSNQDSSDKSNIIHIFMTYLISFVIGSEWIARQQMKIFKNNLYDRNKIDLSKFLHHCYRLFRKEPLFFSSEKYQKLKHKTCQVFFAGYLFSSSCIEIPSAININNKKEEKRKAFFNIIFMTLHRLGFSIVCRSDETILFFTTGIQKLTQDKLLDAFRESLYEKILLKQEEYVRFIELMKAHRTRKRALKYEGTEDIDARTFVSQLFFLPASENMGTKAQEVKANEQVKKTKTKTRPAHSTPGIQNGAEQPPRTNIICWNNVRGDEYVYDPEDVDTHIFPVTDRVNTFVIFVLWRLSNSDFNTDKQHRDVKSKAMVARFGGNSQCWARLWVSESRQRVTYGRSGRRAELLAYELVLKLGGRTYGDLRVFARSAEAFSSNEGVPLYVADMVCTHAHKR